MPTTTDRDKVQVNAAIRDGDDWKLFAIEGELVAPGLAITPALRPNADTHQPEPRPNRWTMTHTPTGRSFGLSRCRTHIEQAAQLAAEAPVDWTTPDMHAVADAVKATTLLLDIRAAMRNPCPDRKPDCSQPDPPTWRVRCKTCTWEWGEDDEEGVLDAKEAKQVAQDHDCEPWVQISPPDGDDWLSPMWVNDDGTRRELR